LRRIESNSGPPIPRSGPPQASSGIRWAGYKSGHGGASRLGGMHMGGGSHERTSHDVTAVPRPPAGWSVWASAEVWRAMLTGELNAGAQATALERETV
jgi:hypothetical protein